MAENDKMIVRVGSTDVDMNKFTPITQRDKIRIKKDLGISLENLREATPEDEAKLAHLFIQKVHPEATFDEVCDMPAKIVQEINLFAFRRSTEVDSPFSRPSTLLPGTTDGGSGN